MTSRTRSNDRTVIAGAVRVRILIATDYAREGLDLQNHCCNIFHFDVPWNPARFEQRNGRIDRTLQPSRHVWCRYFAYADRREDAVLDTLVKKVETIQRELGTLSDVVMLRMDRALALGIQTDTGAVLDGAERPTARERTTQDELESQGVTVDRLKREPNDAGKIQERATLRPARASAEVGADAGQPPPDASQGRARMGRRKSRSRTRASQRVPSRRRGKPRKPSELAWRNFSQVR